MDKFKLMLDTINKEKTKPCDHKENVLSETIINSKNQEVCTECCKHEITEIDRGNRYCVECFIMLPQQFRYGPPVKKKC